MSGEKVIVYVLANNGTYNAHVGGSSAPARIYEDETEQGSAFPNTMVRGETIDPTDTKQNSNFDHDLIQVFHSADTKTKSRQMSIDARTALEAAGGTINGIVVSEIRLVDGHSFTENIENKKIFTIEQIYRVTINI